MLVRCNAGYLRTALQDVDLRDRGTALPHRREFSGRSGSTVDPWPLYGWARSAHDCAQFSEPVQSRIRVRSHRRTLPSPLGTTGAGRSEEHTSELQSLMRISYAVFCLKKTHSIIKLHKINVSI